MFRSSGAISLGHILTEKYSGSAEQRVITGALVAISARPISQRQVCMTPEAVFFIVSNVAVKDV